LGMLRKTLTRLGSSGLGPLLGPETIQLLELLGLKHLSASNLADLAIDQNGSEGLLGDRAIRTDIIDALSKSDAERLARLLRLEDAEDPWSSIRKLSFARKNIQTKVLFAFFECPIVDEEDVFDASKILNLRVNKIDKLIGGVR